MLTTIRQVNEEFFRKFYGLKMLMGGAEKTVLCRYARKSSYDYVEEQSNQIYPCIAIQDYTPTPKKEWYIDMHAYFDGKSLDGLTGYLYQRPIWMEFRYDVSIVAKSYNDFLVMQDYFMENFVYGKRFIFNQQLSGEDTVGDIVPYEIRETDIPRTDGVFEMNYEFTCSVWLYPQKPKEVDLIQTIVLRGTPVALGEMGESLLESIRAQKKFATKIIPYDGSSIDGNNNVTRLGTATIVGGIAELLKEDLGGFTVCLYKGEILLDRGTTSKKGVAELMLPSTLGDYRVKLSKGGQEVEAVFSLKDINLDLVFLWVFK